MIDERVIGEQMTEDPTRTAPPPSPVHGPRFTIPDPLLPDSLLHFFTVSQSRF
jgi:hypothetical protein